MHIIERYALSCGIPIRKPFIITKFFPITVDKYITFHPFSKFPSKCYDYWQDVIDILSLPLARLNISIVQIGTKDDKVFNGTYYTAGQTNIGQAAHIVSNSMLHLGADSFATHIASGFGKKIVCLYSNNFANDVRPYWGHPSDHILFEPDRSNNKPSFAAQENPKTINQIKPEDIAEAVLRLLGVQHEETYRTEYIGGFYPNRMYESVPNQVVDVRVFGVDALILRMDFLFDENVLVEQLKVCPACIVSNKPINLNILKQFKPNVKELVYCLDKSQDSSFVQSLHEAGIVYFLTTDLNGDSLNDIKLDYLDLGIINPKPHTPQAAIDKLRGLNKQLFYKSNKFTLSNGKIYPSKAALDKDSPIDKFDTVTQVIDTPEFWKEAESFKILSTRN